MNEATSIACPVRRPGSATEWVEEKQIAAKVVEELLSGVGDLAATLIGKAKFAGATGRIAAVIGRESEALTA